MPLPFSSRAANAWARETVGALPLVKYEAVLATYLSYAISAIFTPGPIILFNFACDPRLIECQPVPTSHKIVPEKMIFKRGGVHE